MMKDAKIEFADDGTFVYTQWATSIQYGDYTLSQGAGSMHMTRAMLNGEDKTLDSTNEITYENNELSLKTSNNGNGVYLIFKLKTTD